MWAIEWSRDRSNISPKLLELETSNLVGASGFVLGMPSSRRTNNFPESGRGLGHVTPTIFGSTVGYPSDSLASRYLGHVIKISCNVKATEMAIENREQRAAAAAHQCQSLALGLQTPHGIQSPAYHRPHEEVEQRPVARSVNCLPPRQTEGRQAQLYTNQPVTQSMSLTAHLLAPLENISRPSYFHYQFRAWGNSSLSTR